MTHYRIIFSDELSDDGSADVIEADSPEEAVQKFAEAYGWTTEGLEATGYTATIAHDCLCGANRTFTNLEHPAYPGNWKCSGCGETYGLPPDQINWRWEEKFEAGLVPCVCEGYNERCICGGTGWVRRELPEEAWLDTWDYDAEEEEY